VAERTLAWHTTSSRCKSASKLSSARLVRQARFAATQSLCRCRMCSSMPTYKQQNKLKPSATTRPRPFWEPTKFAELDTPKSSDLHNTSVCMLALLVLLAFASLVSWLSNRTSKRLFMQQVGAHMMKKFKPNDHLMQPTSRCNQPTNQPFGSQHDVQNAWNRFGVWLLRRGCLLHC